MKINLSYSNPALNSLFENPEQIITLDANFLIPPDRKRYIKVNLIFNYLKTFG